MLLQHLIICPAPAAVEFHFRYFSARIPRRAVQPRQARDHAARLAALDDVEHLTLATRSNREEMARLVPALRARGFKVYDSQANFVLVDVHQDGEQLFQKLLRRGVIVRPVSNYGLTTCVRVTIGTPAQNDRLLAAIDEVLR